MKIKKGDKVLVIAGKDKGKSGTIVRVLQDKNRIVLEGINMAKKHRARTGNARAGQIVERAMPLHASNVMLVDPKSGKPTRIRIEKKDGERIRVAVKSGTHI